MSTNLRSDKVSGYLIDGAGNIMRNTKVTVRIKSGVGDNVVSEVYTDDSGAFTTDPLPNGKYYVYESGVLASIIVHTPDKNSIQCYAVEDGNAPSVNDLLATDDPNDFVAFVQIEPTDLNVARYGNSFPLSNLTVGEDNQSNVQNLKALLSLDDNSKLSLTKFDVEYYNPIVSDISSYKRVRCSGVTAFSYSGSSRLVVPMTYRNIVANNPRQTITGTVTIGDNSIGIAGIDATIGDIIRVKKASDAMDYYGIVTSIESTNNIYTTTKWVSGYKEFEIPTSKEYVDSDVEVYDGLFSGLNSLGSDTNTLITVTENVSAQNQFEDLCRY